VPRLPPLESSIRVQESRLLRETRGRYSRDLRRSDGVPFKPDTPRRERGNASTSSLLILPISSSCSSNWVAHVCPTGIFNFHWFLLSDNSSSLRVYRFLIRKFRIFRFVIKSMINLSTGQRRYNAGRIAKGIFETDRADAAEATRNSFLAHFLTSVMTFKPTAARQGGS